MGNSVQADLGCGFIAAIAHSSDWLCDSALESSEDVSPGSTQLHGIFSGKLVIISLSLEALSSLPK